MPSGPTTLTTTMWRKYRYRSKHREKWRVTIPGRNWKRLWPTTLAIVHETFFFSFGISSFENQRYRFGNVVVNGQDFSLGNWPTQRYIQDNDQQDHHLATKKKLRPGPATWTFVSDTDGHTVTQLIRKRATSVIQCFRTNIVNWQKRISLIWSTRRHIWEILFRVKLWQTQLLQTMYHYIKFGFYELSSSWLIRCDYNFGRHQNTDGLNHIIYLSGLLGQTSDRSKFRYVGWEFRMIGRRQHTINMDKVCNLRSSK